jgi:hypothetical protein
VLGVDPELHRLGKEAVGKEAVGKEAAFCQNDFFETLPREPVGCRSRCVAAVPGQLRRDPGAGP